jgi:polyphosphate kinase
MVRSPDEKDQQMSVTDPLPLPFDGAISRYLADEAPDEVRQAIRDGGKRDILSQRYPYDRWMKKADYEAAARAQQIELVKLQAWVQATGARVVIVFEGRDTAGKSGAIARVSQNLNPRVARINALPAPTERERGQWYFQRYVDRLPARGEIALFDRSWYNRAVIEPVFGFCTPQQRAQFFAQLPDFERMLVEDGITLIKLWFNVGRAEQLRRMLERERHPLKQWKLSRIDVDGLAKWDDYTAAIREMFDSSDFDHARWTVILGDDKYRARLGAVEAILSRLDYARKDPGGVGVRDPVVVGGADIWPHW